MTGEKGEEYGRKGTFKRALTSEKTGTLTVNSDRNLRLART